MRTLRTSCVISASAAMPVLYADMACCIKNHTALFIKDTTVLIYPFIIRYSGADLLA
jgi:hypothetical protein